MMFFCHACNRNSTEELYTDQGERMCALCGSEFLEEVEVRPQPPQRNATSSFAVGGNQFSVSVSTSTLDSHDAIGEMFERVFGDLMRVRMAAMPSESASAFLELGQNPLRPAPAASLGDFAIGSGFDNILAQLLEAHQPAYRATAKEAKDALPQRKVAPPGIAPGSSVGASEEKFASVPTGEPCSVCHEEFMPEEHVTELPCCHCFHGDCISPWLDTHNTCPVCRHELPAESRSAAAQSSAGAGAATGGAFGTAENAFGLPPSLAQLFSALTQRGPPRAPQTQPDQNPSQQ